MGGNHAGGGRDLIDRDAELDAALAGRDVWMGLGVTSGFTRIPTVTARRSLLGDAREPLELVTRLDIEVTETRAYGQPQLLLGSSRHH